MTSKAKTEHIEEVLAKADDFTARMTGQPWACEIIESLADALRTDQRKEREAGDAADPNLNARDEIVTRILDLSVVGKVLSDMTALEGDMFHDELRCVVTDVLVNNASATAALTSPAQVEALRKIEGGHIEGAGDLVLSGNWQGLVAKMQEIARTALSASSLSTKESPEQLRERCAREAERSPPPSALCPSQPEVGNE